MFGYSAKTPVCSEKNSSSYSYHVTWTMTKIIELTAWCCKNRGGFGTAQVSQLALNGHSVFGGSLQSLQLLFCSIARYFDGYSRPRCFWRDEGKTRHCHFSGILISMSVFRMETFLLIYVFRLLLCWMWLFIKNSVVYIFVLYICTFFF